MRFIIYGAGAVGGVIGGRLFQADHAVTLIARGEHLRALQHRGLTLAAPSGTATLPIPAVGDPGDAEPNPGDVVVLAMKGQHTEAALDDLRRAAPPGVAVVCAQNGVENERKALRCFPDVYGVSVMLPATHLEPGVVLCHSAGLSGLLDLGRYPTGVDATATAVAEALTGAGFESEARADIMRWKYRKLLLNLGNAVEAVCGGDARRGPLYGLVMEEGAAVLAAAGIDPVSGEEDRERRGELLRMKPIEGVRREGGSSWQSLARGQGSIEADYLNGEIVLLGRLHGVPTPANELFQRLAVQFAAEGRRPGSLSVDEALALLDG
jgi:2-dehydropantoate 2-reductase